MKKIKSGLLALAVAVGCFFLGKYSTPAKVEIKEVEKIVYKESSTIKTNLNRDTDKVITEKPDGTKITEIKMRTERTSETEKNSELNKQTEVSQKITNRPNYRINLGYYPNLINPKEFYSIGGEIRVLSELYVGVKVTTESRPQIGFTLSLGL